MQQAGSSCMGSTKEKIVQLNVAIVYKKAPGSIVARGLVIKYLNQSYNKSNIRNNITVKPKPQYMTPLTLA